MGDYRNYWKYFLYLRYGFNKRIRFHKQKVWLNGGFDLNIRGRLEDRRFKVIAETDSMAEHLNKITGFFAASKRNMLGYVDTPEEIEMWKKYVEKLCKLGEYEQLKFDYEFLSDLALRFSLEGIDDPLLNSETLGELFQTSLQQ